MPRSNTSRGSSNRNSFGGKSSRNAFFTRHPPKASRTNTNNSKSNTNLNNRSQSSQYRNPIMGALMGGMAFGLGSELIRSMFGNRLGDSMAFNVLPLLFSGLISYSAFKYMKLIGTKNYKLYTGIIFVGSYILLKGPGNILYGNNRFDDIDHNQLNQDNSLDYNKRI